ncbi:MAG: hypothetical protein IPN65_09575 [Elusimicrobia bacterium]|nr:hypothetical protein [Elusimicrobiota bacterium]
MITTSPPAVSNTNELGCTVMVPPRARLCFTLLVLYPTRVTSDTTLVFWYSPIAKDSVTRHAGISPAAPRRQSKSTAFHPKVKNAAGIATITIHPTV